VIQMAQRRSEGRNLPDEQRVSLNVCIVGDHFLQHGHESPFLFYFELEFNDCTLRQQ